VTTRFLVVLALTACAPRAFEPADDQAIRAVIGAQAAAWNRGDLAGYMAGYANSPDLVFTSGGQIRRGWQETYDRYRTRYGGDPSTMGHLDFELIQIQPLGSRVVLRAQIGKINFAGGDESAAPEFFEPGVDHDALEPAIESRSTAQLVQGAPGRYKHLLRQVITEA